MNLPIPPLLWRTRWLPRSNSAHGRNTVSGLLRQAVNGLSEGGIRASTSTPPHCKAQLTAAVAAVLAVYERTEVVALGICRGGVAVGVFLSTPSVCTLGALATQAAAVVDDTVWDFTSFECALSRGLDERGQPQSAFWSAGRPRRAPGPEGSARILRLHLDDERSLRRRLQRASFPIRNRRMFPRAREPHVRGASSRRRHPRCLTPT